MTTDNATPLEVLEVSDEDRGKADFLSSAVRASDPSPLGQGSYILGQRVAAGVHPRDIAKAIGFSESQIDVVANEQGEAFVGFLAGYVFAQQNLAAQAEAGR